MWTVYQSPYSMTGLMASCVASSSLQVSANKPSYSIGASTQLSFAANITSNGSGALNVSREGSSAHINGACVPTSQSLSIIQLSDLPVGLMSDFLSGQ